MHSDMVQLGFGGSYERVAAFMRNCKGERSELDLSRFDAAPLIAFTATKKIDYGTETDGRISPRCGVYCTDQWFNA